MKKIPILLAVMLTGITASATDVWTGAVDNDFNNAGNWTDGSVVFGPPIAANDAYFDITGANKNISFTTSLNQRNFLMNGGNYTLTPVTSETITIANSGAFKQMNSGTWSIYTPLVASTGNPLTFSGDGIGALTFGGSVNLSALAANTTVLLKNNSSDVTFTNVITLGTSNILSLLAGRTILSGSAALTDVTNTIRLGTVNPGTDGPGALYSSGRYVDPSGAALILDDAATVVANRLGGQVRIETALASLLELRGSTSSPSAQASSQSLVLAGPGTKIRIRNGVSQSAQLRFNSLFYANTYNKVPTNNLDNYATVVQYLVPAGSTLGATGSTGGRLIFSNAPPLVNGLLRYGVIKDEASGAVNFATYNSTVDNGAPIGVTAFAGYTTTDLNVSNSLANVDVSGSVILTNTVNFNAIRITPTAPGQSITITNGNGLGIGNGIMGASGLIFAGGYDYAINGTSGTVANDNSAYFYINSNTLSIVRPYAISGFSSSDLAKAGNGLLSFSYFQFNSPRPVYADKGANGGDDMTMNTVRGTTTATFGGPGQLALVGAADNGGTNYTNSFSIKGGTVMLAKDSAALQNGAMGSGPLLLSGGALGARGFPVTLTNTLSLANVGGLGYANVIVGNQPITLAGVVQGNASSGQTYELFNNSSAVLTLSGAVQGFNTNRTTSQTSTLNFNGSGKTEISGTLRNTDPAWPNLGGTMVTALQKEGPGLLVLSGANTYTGITTVDSGYLRLDNASALSPSRIIVGSRQNYYGTNGGYAVLELGTGNTSFTRPLGSTDSAAQIQVGQTGGQNLGHGGFASVTGTATVNLGGAGAGVQWGVNRFFQSVNGSPATLQSVFVLGSPYCAGTVDFQNPIDLVLNTRTFAALDGGADVDGKISGVISSATSTSGVTKIEAGTLELAAANTYTGPTTINGGRLLVSGSLAAGSTVNVNSGGTLGGTGTINGQVNVNAGGTLSPGASIGTLTINNNLVLDSSSKTVVEINAATGAKDLVTGLFNVAYDGTLVVTNLSGTVTNGQSFQIFSAATPFGNFGSISNQVAGVTSWSFNPASGVLTATVSAVAPTPTNITYSVSGTSPNQQLVLKWPAGQGWQLQAQTNNLTTGLTTNWFTVTGATPPFTNTINPANGSVFYRLKY